MWTATKMTDKLLSLSKSAAQPGSDNQKSKVHQDISYTKNKVIQPWQIVLITNDAKKIVIKGSGDNKKIPLLSTSVKVSTY